MVTQGGCARQLSLVTSPNSWFCMDDPDRDYVGKITNKPHLEIQVEGIEMDGYSTLFAASVFPLKPRYTGEIIHERPRWGLDLSASGHTDPQSFTKDKDRHPESLAYTNCSELKPVLWVQSPNNIRNEYEIPPNGTLVVPAALAHGFKCLPMPLNGEPKPRLFILRTRMRDNEHSLEQSVITYEAPIDDPDPCVYNPPYFQPWLRVLEQERNITHHMTMVEANLLAGGPFMFGVAGQHSMRLASTQMLMRVCGPNEDKFRECNIAAAIVPVEQPLPTQELSDLSDASEPDEQ